MLQQEEYRSGDHRMACRTLWVRRPISADFPWTLCPALAQARVFLRRWMLDVVPGGLASYAPAILSFVVFSCQFRERKEQLPIMKICNLRIENFRSIETLELDLEDTTVFIGPNNAGKSAVLEALRIGLSRRWGQRGTGFTEEDVRRTDDASDPRSSPPVRIQFTFREAATGEWSEDMISDLDEVAVVTADGRNQIILSIKYIWNWETETFQPIWEFLDADGQPLQGRRRSINTSPFFEYLWFFWLGALRDADDEFSSRSRNWGGLLRSARIPTELEAEIKTALDQLDGKILAADPRFSRIAETLGLATKIAIHDTPGAARLRMLPMDVWDMLSRAGVCCETKATGRGCHFPITARDCKACPLFFSCRLQWRSSF
jgi:hypothetical protein